VMRAARQVANAIVLDQRDPVGERSSVGVAHRERRLSTLSRTRTRLPRPRAPRSVGLTRHSRAPRRRRAYRAHARRIGASLSEHDTREQPQRCGGATRCEVRAQRRPRSDHAVSTLVSTAERKRRNEFDRLCLRSVRCVQDGHVAAPH
jgi:hypothetical protein